MDTFFGHWVDFKATVRNFRITFYAIPVIFSLDAALGHLDAQQIPLPLPLLRFSHGLLLHGIHARQPADRLLIQFDS